MLTLNYMIKMFYFFLCPMGGDIMMQTPMEIVL